MPTGAQGRDGNPKRESAAGGPGGVANPMTPPQGTQTMQEEQMLEHWKDPDNKWDGTKDIDFMKQYPQLLEQIKRLKYWINKDDGTGLDYGKIENSIADLIEAAKKAGAEEGYAKGMAKGIMLSQCQCKDCIDLRIKHTQALSHPTEDTTNQDPGIQNRYTNEEMRKNPLI